MMRHLIRQSFIKKVAACPECPKSACPSPERYMRAYDCEAEHIYAVTLSSELSGSYNSALLGRDLIMEDHPDKKIHVFNSRSASIGESLIGMKIQECEEAGMSFEEVVSTVEHYIEGQHTFFVLENLDTLRKNGRLSKVKALVASALKIKPVMGSTDDGTYLSAGSGKRHESCSDQDCRAGNRENSRQCREGSCHQSLQLSGREHRCSKKHLKRE